jgi:mono/diheme cytochrome c family protein
MSASVRGALVAALALVATSLGCSRGGGPGTTDEFGGTSVGFVGGACLPVTSNETLAARSEVTAPTGATGNGDVFFTSILFARVDAYCGACHDGGQNGFSSKNQDQDWQNVFARIESDDAASPGGFMPPVSANGKAWSARLSDPNDPVVEMVHLLQLWIAQGKPGGSFSLAFAAPVDAAAPTDAAASSDDAGTPTDDPTSTDDASLPGHAGEAADASASDAPSGGVSQGDYALTPAQGAKLTNIGTCVPNKYAVAVDTGAMDKLDAFFAAATALPDTLDATDLVTFDSEALARNGVISYFPAYPLWSDDAGKMRHVRTPRGQPIVFDERAQKFQIPPNTRFYKTFFKQVVDASGQQAWKRIETRLIVSRPDETLPDGTIKQTALFGTYVWDETETKAVLLTDPLRDGQPFTDRLVPYVADEPRARAIRAGFPNPKDDYRLNQALGAPGVLRHYAIPGSGRCVQCHMGSPSEAFVLGFTPLQVATKAPGWSGVIEKATSDELTQLQRLIDYGVITGMTSPAAVTPLERTQLPRAPRNEAELRAQAYMIGNCSHCHNPRGFPSVKAPELKDVLNFLPGPDGGVFQFPLDRVSPVRARGPKQDVPIPYLTPSLRDLPGRTPAKYVTCDPDTVETDGWCAKPKQTIDFIDAPWRSLIYRNVDTPFDYVDDYAIFPHMPLNTPGYDCRVAQIMGDWMVSIPAVRANPKSNEDDVTLTSGDSTPQPYLEVLPGDSGYAAAQTAAQKRLATYHAGHRYGFCPNTTDIVDPAVLNGDPSKGDPQTPIDFPITDDSTSPPQLVMPQEGVPNRAHWVVTDSTDPPGDWLPRGTQWKQALVAGVAANATISGDALASLEEVLGLLKNDAISLDAAAGASTVRQILTRQVPFGLWKQKPGCSFGGAPTAGSFQGDAQPLWLAKAIAKSPRDVAGAPTFDLNAPVYVQSLGAAVFTNICINCHGPAADAKGLLADEISIMTGGDARVANFRTGLFGPAGAPGTNRARVFVHDASDPTSPPDLAPGAPGYVSPDDYGARYMAWMALGGTQKILPPALLTLVAATPVLGQSRNSLDARGTANMLQLARQLCTDVLLSNDNHTSANLGDYFKYRTLDWTNQTSLIGENGDAELWLQVCSLGNRPVVRVALPDTADGSWPDPTNALDALQPAQLRIASLARSADPKLGDGANHQSFYWGDGRDAQGNLAYPADAPVMDHRGHVRAGLGPDNLFPVCVRRPSDPTQKNRADAFLQSHPVGGQSGEILPYCPDSLFAKDDSGAERWALANPTDPDTGSHLYTDANHWANRGAINAGLAVFLYVDELSRGQTPKPLYNQCEQLAGAAP